MQRPPRQLNETLGSSKESGGESCGTSEVQIQREFVGISNSIVVVGSRGHGSTMTPARNRRRGSSRASDRVCQPQSFNWP